MRFYMPAKLYSEHNCVLNHSSQLSSLGSHALIVTGEGSSKKNGSLDDVISALTAHGTDYTVFSGVEENPCVETVMKARDVGVECGADFVIGIGGGSPIDASKAAALMTANPDKGWEYMYESSGGKALPLAAVPTTCGTGSEVTGVSVITRHDLKTKVSLKHKIFPDLALVDGKYLLSAPHYLIVNTSIDAFSHLIESGVNTLADRASMMLVKTGLSMWKECRPYIEGREELTEEAALRLMEASVFGGMSIAQTGTTIPHALSYMLTYSAGIPHGAAVGAFQANYLRCTEKGLRDELLEAAEFSDVDELDDFIKRMAPVKAEKELLMRSAQSVLSKPEKLALCPFKPDKDTILSMIDI